MVFSDECSSSRVNWLLCRQLDTSIPRGCGSNDTRIVDIGLTSIDRQLRGAIRNNHAARGVFCDATCARHVEFPDPWDPVAPPIEVRGVDRIQEDDNDWWIGGRGHTKSYRTRQRRALLVRDATADPLLRHFDSHKYQGPYERILDKAAAQSDVTHQLESSRYRANYHRVNFPCVYMCELVLQLKRG